MGTFWKTIQIIPVSVPMWAVYYDRDKDGLFTLPVLCLGLDEPDPETTDAPEIDREVHPYTLQGDGYIGFEGYPGASEAANFLGYSMVDSPKKEDWWEEIERYWAGIKKEKDDTCTRCGERPASRYDGLCGECGEAFDAEMAKE